jgi:SAM-dependent methyltransferase
MAGRASISTMLELLPPVALRVAATLRLSDHLAGGARSVPELARATGADPDALGRLLRYLACLGVYRESGADRFEPTPAGRLLATRHPGGLRQWLDLDGAGGRMDLALAGLLHSVRTGEPGYPVVHRQPLWEELAGDPDRSASFDELMAAKSGRVARDLAARDWPGVTRLVDVGGGVGRTAIAIAAAQPGMRVVLLELPAVAERARRAVAEAGLAGRIEVRAGSFHRTVPAGGDAYLLFDILHNWDDRTAGAVLRRCLAAAGPAGRVLVVEELPAGPGDRAGRAMDLKMLVLFGGRQRSAAEFGRLAAAAGGRLAGVDRLPGGFSVLAVAPAAVRGGS